MKEYVFEIAEEDSDYAEVFYGWIRNHSRELIRCKDCTHYRGDHEYCENDMFAVEDGFCNWAERKEE